MQEIELKISLDPIQERHLRNSAPLRAMTVGPVRTRRLLSIYYDTPDHDLRAAGISLRLRKIGRQWVQTLKRMSGGIVNGLSQPEEIEYPVNDAQIDLTRIGDDDLRELVIGISRAGLEPVARTEFKRTSRLVRTEGGAGAELCIDRGELASGRVVAPIIEAEIELVEGTWRDLYHIAGVLFRTGPIRYSRQSKAERALALSAAEPVAPTLRKARPVDLAGAGSWQEAGARVLGEALDHALPNIVASAEDDAPEGPHQVRVGLRRFRTGLSVFRKSIAPDVRRALTDRARAIAGAAGGVRDLDVLIDETLVRLGARYPEEAADIACLAAHLGPQRDDARVRMRRVLCGPEAAAFAFDAAEQVAVLGQSGALPAKRKKRARELVLKAARTLDQRLEAVAAYGQRIDELTIPERHEMRKAVKKLRYAADALGSLFDAEAVLAVIKALKPLQKTLGALNDCAVADTILQHQTPAKGARDPAIERAIGLARGHLGAEADAAWPGAVAAWRTLDATRLFWREA